MADNIFFIINRIADLERSIEDKSWENFKENRSKEIQEELSLGKFIKRGRKRQLDIYTYFLESKLKDY